MNFPPDDALTGSRLQLMKRVLEPPKKAEPKLATWIAAIMVFGMVAAFLLFVKLGG